MLKSIVFLAFIIILLSSCSYGTYELNKGPLDIEAKANYTVTYKVTAPNNATISFTDESGEQKMVENVSGEWEKTVQIKAGQKVVFNVDAKGENKGLQQTAVFVDQKLVSEMSKTGKVSHYRLSFVLP